MNGPVPTTTDEFVQQAIAGGDDRDEAWKEYTRRAGAISRAQFEETWAYWTAEMIAAYDA